MKIGIKVIKFFCLLLTLLFLYSAPLLAESISGTIRYSDTPGGLLPATTIFLYNTGVYSTIVSSVPTNRIDGSYLFNTVNPGIYDMKVVCKGYSEGTLAYIVVKQNENKIGISLTLTKPSGDIELFAKNLLHCTLEGTWSEGTYGADYVFASAGTANKATWSVSIAVDSKFEIYLYWLTGGNRATDAKFTVYHKDGSTEFSVDQASGNSKRLGIFEFLAGTTAKIELNAQTSAGGVVIAERIKLVDKSEKTPPGPPQALSSKVDGGKITLSWNIPAAGVISGYKVYRSTAPSIASSRAMLKTMPIAVDINSTTWTDDSAQNNTWYYYSITAVDTAYVESLPTFEVSEIVVSAPVLECKAMPNKFKPANSEKAVIKYKIKGVETGQIIIKIYNLAGEKVKTLVSNQTVTSNTDYTIEWDGKNDNGELVSSGVYLVHIGLGGTKDIKRVMLIK